MAGEIAPVIAGLCIGIAFVVLFSFFFDADMIVPTAQPIDDDGLSQTAYNLPEVKAFREKFGQIGATGHSSSDFDGTVICYSYPPIPCEPENEDKITSYLEVTMDAKGQPVKFTIYCNSNGLKGGATAAEIDVEEFLETAEYCPK